MAIALVRTKAFDAWLADLTDLYGRARIIARLRSAAFGNFGDTASVGDGVFEMLIHAGPGYRVYYTRTGETIYVVLAGGNKSSQKRDIVAAKAMSQAIKDGKNGR